MNESKGSWGSGSAVPMKNGRSLVPVQKPAVPHAGHEVSIPQSGCAVGQHSICCPGQQGVAFIPQSTWTSPCCSFLLARKGLCPVLTGNHAASYGMVYLEHESRLASSYLLLKGQLVGKQANFSLMLKLFSWLSKNRRKAHCSEMRQQLR